MGNKHFDKKQPQENRKKLLDYMLLHCSGIHNAKKKAELAKIFEPPLSIHTISNYLKRIYHVDKVPIHWSTEIEKGPLGVYLQPNEEKAMDSILIKYASISTENKTINDLSKNLQKDPDKWKKPVLPTKYDDVSIFHKTVAYLIFTRCNGHDNVKTMDELQAIANDYAGNIPIRKRNVKYYIRVARAEYPICSCEEGYYWPKDKTELKHSVDHLLKHFWSKSNTYRHTPEFPAYLIKHLRQDPALSHMVPHK